MSSPSRLGPLWAPISASAYLLALGASIVLDGNAPDNGTTSGATVLAFYEAHRDSMIASAAVVVIAAAAVVACYGALRAHLAQAPQVEGAATTALVGSAVYAGSLCLSAGAALALTNSTRLIGPDSAQALSLLRAEVNTPFAATGTALMLGSLGWAILRSHLLPTWLGWTAFVVAVIALVPTLTIPAVLLAAVWTLVAGILVSRRDLSREEA